MIKSYKFLSFAKITPWLTSRITVKIIKKWFARSAFQKITQIIHLNVCKFFSKISMHLWSKAEKYYYRWMKTLFQFWNKLSFLSKKISYMRLLKLKNSLIVFHITFLFRATSKFLKKAKFKSRTGSVKTIKQIFLN